MHLLCSAMVLAASGSAAALGVGRARNAFLRSLVALGWEGHVLRPHLSC